jgi:2-C-methyl-D-erythritol 4-phosphate cytidylyltransferase
MSQPRRIDVDEDIVVLVGDGEIDDERIATLVERLRRDASLDATGHLVPVVDAVKEVDHRDQVVSTLDRSRLGHLGLPLAVRRRAIDPTTGDLAIRHVGLV